MFESTLSKEDYLNVVVGLIQSGEVLKSKNKSS